VTQSDADRARAYRERKKEQQARDEELAEDLMRLRWGYAPSETRTWAERQATADRIMAKCGGRPGGDARTRYIEEAVRAARSVTPQGDLRDAKAEAGREERAGKYAEWRWDGYVSGEVASL